MEKNKVLIDSMKIGGIAAVLSYLLGKILSPLTIPLLQSSSGAVIPWIIFLTAFVRYAAGMLAADLIYFKLIAKEKRNVISSLFSSAVSAVAIYFVNQLLGRLHILFGAAGMILNLAICLLIYAAAAWLFMPHIAAENKGKPDVFKIVHILSLVILVAGIAMFVIGATTGTITGYQGADGQYYSDPDAVGSNEWMCMPGFIMAVIGGFTYKVSKK